MRHSAIVGSILAAAALVRADSALIAVCKQIQQAVSPASEVFWPRECKRRELSLRSHSLTSLAVSLGYSKDIEHWATTSTQNSACSVEPGTAADVGTVVSK